ncbi:MAG: maltose ABC transporter permease MalF [Vibrio sp.]
MMQSQISDFNPHATSQPDWLAAFKKHGVKWLALSLVSLINGYACVLMYARAEYVFALLTLVLTSAGVYVFARKKTYAHRYIYPGVAGMVLFVIFPLLYTLGLAFTNYSGSNQLSFERAQNVLLSQSFQTGSKMPFQLFQSDQGYQIALKNNDTWLVSPWIDHLDPSLKPKSVTAQEKDPSADIPQPEDATLNAAQITLEATDSFTPTVEPLKLKSIISMRQVLSQLKLNTQDGQVLTMSGLRNFAAVSPLYQLQDDGRGLLNVKSQTLLMPNDEIGHYQAVNEQGEFVGQPLTPGYVVQIGWDNFERIFNDPGIKEPFVEIFIWTIVFAALTVLLTLAIGVVLAQVVSWEALRGRGLYRVLLILPYAVPAFISILIFKGLFNQSFGEINQLLEAMFGVAPNWFTDPTLAKTMLIIVNTWLGYPYMMILAMGMLKSIPSDLYEASAMDGAGPLDNFFKITLPLLIKPMAPLLIASFAFNFNNFVLIQLLTNGAPDIIGSSVPAGHTDLLVSYTYRIAFEGSGGQDFGLAAAIATLIFILVGALSLLNMRFTKLDAQGDH